MFKFFKRNKKSAAITSITLIKGSGATLVVDPCDSGVHVVRAVVDGKTVAECDGKLIVAQGCLTLDLDGNGLETVQNLGVHAAGDPIAFLEACASYAKSALVLAATDALEQGDCEALKRVSILLDQAGEAANRSNCPGVPCVVRARVSILLDQADEAAYRSNCPEDSVDPQAPMPAGPVLAS